MAHLIRNTHELATIRVELRPSRSGAEVQFTSYRGTNELERHAVPAADVGIQPDLTVRAYRYADFQVPDAVLAPITGSLQATATGPDEPCWLQVGSSTGHLGVVPWEQFFQPALQHPLLRIPNFLADPVFLGERLRAALVVSSPRAKSPFDVAHYVHDLAALVQQAVPRGSELHVFADVEAYGSLQHLPAPPGHDVIVHDPAEAAGYGLGGTNLPAGRKAGLEGRLVSPWLRWIRGKLYGRALDLVHFVCPGFFRRDQGALALARSPGENQDREWSHFVGADELIAFLDLMGAWSVGFSPPYENVWSIGLRILADRLAWQRPGPLFVHDSEHGGPGELVALYRFLYHSDDEQPPATPNLSLYSHPRRMERYRESPFDAFEAVVRQSFGAPADVEIPEQLVYLAEKQDRSARSYGKSARSAWVQTNGLQLDRMLLNLGKSDTPTRRGALDALQKVRAIFESAKTHDDDPHPSPGRPLDVDDKDDDEEGRGQAMGGAMA